MTDTVFLLPFDQTGQAASNLKTENYPVPVYKLILPEWGAFYSNSLIVITDQGVTLTKGVDYHVGDFLSLSSRELKKAIHCCIVMAAGVTATSVNVTAQYVGGPEYASRQAFFAAYNAIFNPNQTFDWVTDILKPKQFTPAPHIHQLYTYYDMDQISVPIQALEAVMHVKDTAIHDHILQVAWPATNAEFIQLVDQRQQSITDAIEQQVFNIRKETLEQKALIDDSVDRTIMLQDRLVRQKWMNSRQQKYFQNITQALALKHIAAKWALTQRHFDSPKHIQDLTCWFDFSRVADNNTTYWRDHTGQSRSLMLNGATVQGPGLSLSSAVSDISGLAVSTGAEVTLCLVVSNDFKGQVKLAHETIEIDLTQDVGIRINGMVYAKSYQGHAQDATVLYFACTGDVNQSYFLSSQNARQYGKWSGLEKPLTLQSGGLVGLQALPNSSGQVIEFLVYGRLLSLYEIDVLDDYFKRHHNCFSVVNSNAYFSGGWQDFDFSFGRQDAAFGAGTGAIVEHIPNMVYVSHPFAFVLSKVGVGRSFLSRRSSVNTSLVDWTQAVTSAAKTSHQITITLHVEPGQTLNFDLRANGVLIGSYQHNPADTKGVWTTHMTFQTDQVQFELIQTRSVNNIKYALESVVIERNAS